jgi:LCP family protein required for cell wall assembly
MRTTLKRGVGRGAQLNGNGHAVFPPGTISSVSRYEQPPPPGRSGLGLLVRILVGTMLALVALALAIGGGAYLWFHQSVAAVRAHSADVKRAQKQLDVTLPGEAAIALVVGYDQRLGTEHTDISRSDTVMLLRADPGTKTISMLSFPRDLIVPVICKNGFVADDRINSAYARCGSTGTLDTVRNLTRLPINYLITVNFHGFKQIVDDLGGVWMDIDRRYYNKNVGTAATNFANINIQPGYQRLSGEDALEFVRYRHTDSDLYRLARQQQFVRAFKEQVSQHFSIKDLPKIVSAITHNVEVGAKSNFGDQTVLKYALFAATLPGGHFFQVRIDDITGANELQAPASSIQSAVTSFVNPDVTVSKVANATALGKKVKLKSHAPPPQKTTVTVLNGNAVAGSAANASYLLAQRGYLTVLPANGAAPNAPIQNYFHSQIYFDPKQVGAKAAAVQLQKVVAPSDVRPLPKEPALRALDPGSMLLLVTGETFHNDLATPAPVTPVPKRQPAYVRFDSAPGHELLDPLVHRVAFKLELPTILEKSSVPDTLPGDKPSRLYYITKGHKAIRLTFRTGGNEFWGIEETDWPDAPILADRSFQHDLGGREFQLYYSGAHLHMVVLRVGNRSYWVVNTLLDSLSNETMIAIAKGLKPMRGGK